mmetsp:Transcript_53935/g.167156  ORF Transcript_53935/g.167156 Transcript_53935/m.167156 type:complete len:221 (+) Transcript_53935:204-866(+)
MTATPGTGEVAGDVLEMVFAWRCTNEILVFFVLSWWIWERAVASSACATRSAEVARSCASLAVPSCVCASTAFEAAELSANATLSWAATTSALVFWSSASISMSREVAESSESLAASNSRMRSSVICTFWCASVALASVCSSCSWSACSAASFSAANAACCSLASARDRSCSSSASALARALCAARAWDSAFATSLRARTCVARSSCLSWSAQRRDSDFW